MVEEESVVFLKIEVRVKCAIVLDIHRKHSTMISLVITRGLCTFQVLFIIT